MMIAIVCPGQGSQTPGFLSTWLELPEFKKVILQFSESTGLDLVRLGTEGDADEIRDTQVAQPLIVAAGLASYEVLKERLNLSTDAVSGHSVGEITAAAIAGVLDYNSAASFVKVRGEEMAKASALQATSMAAIVGGDSELNHSEIERLGLSAANNNGPGQIVAAGEKSAIEELVSTPPSGSRVIQLQVAGAFHTSFMEPAKSKLAEHANTLTPKDPELAIWTNRDGTEIQSGKEFLDLLVKQVSNPVRWDLCMDSLLSYQVSTVIELLPGGALTGIAKRAMPGVKALALKTPADLEKIAEAIEESKQ
jgi:[acyl-carrier-protein] S-malonyltransferase